MMEVGIYGDGGDSRGGWVGMRGPGVGGVGVLEVLRLVGWGLGDGWWSMVQRLVGCCWGNGKRQENHFREYFA